MAALPDGTVFVGVTPPSRAPEFDPIDAIEHTMSDAARALEGLHEVFERLRALLVLAREERKNEIKIGELFVRAQDYVNEAIANAEERTQQLIADAELEASRIVAAAKQEAERILEDVQHDSGLPPEVVQQLHRTIDAFARANSELLAELTSLSQTLSEHAMVRATDPPPKAHSPAQVRPDMPPPGMLIAPPPPPPPPASTTPSPPPPPPLRLPPPPPQRVVR